MTRPAHLIDGTRAPFGGYGGVAGDRIDDVILGRDNAAAIFVASEPAIRELEQTPRSRDVTGAVAGIWPSLIGLGPAPASKKALTRGSRTAQQIDIAEFDEAFAAPAIPCIEQIGLDPERGNVHGGAIAGGHPLGRRVLASC
jgi:acetyl-CoA acetyltransferase